MPTKPKLPKARHPRWIIEAAESASLVQHPHGFRKEDWDHYRVAVQDAIAKAAPAIALNESARKFWALTPEERVERLARSMQKVDGMSWEIAQTLYRIQARACLAAMGG